MNVGTSTTTATTQGLIAIGRLIATGLSARLLALAIWILLHSAES